MLDLIIHEQQVEELREELDVLWNTDFSYHMMNLLQGHSFTADWFEGIVTPLEINVSKNTLIVSMSGSQKVWNLHHTLIGFIDGEYILTSTL